MFLPATHIPIVPLEALAEARPDYVLVMPWNLRKEIADQLAYVRDWGGQLVVALPRLEIY
jgi:predicted glycosyltransferase